MRGLFASVVLAGCGRIGFEGAIPGDAAPDTAQVVDCTVLADGTPCDDRNICTASSSCVAGACVPPQQQPSCTVARSDAEFDPTQGVDGWFYGFWNPIGDTPYNPDTDFALGVYDPANSAYEPMVPGGEFIYLAAWGGHPKIEPTTIPIRRWVSDVSGPAIALFGVRKADISCGDGVVGHLVVDGVTRSTQMIAFDDGVGGTLPVSLELEVGTRVELHLAPGESEACDTTETELLVTSPAS